MGRGAQGCFTQGRFWGMPRGKEADESARLLLLLQSLNLFSAGGCSLSPSFLL